MMHKKVLGLMGAAVLLMVLTACPQQQQQPPEQQPPEQQPPAQTQTAISGYVVNAGAGEAVVGTTISVYDAGSNDLVATVTTGDDGSYTVEVPEGSYDLKLQKDGYAGSQVLNVRVEENHTTPLNIIERKAFNPDWPTTPPEVTLEGVSDGDVFDASNGYIPYRVVSTPTDPLATNLIYAAIGKTPGAGFLTGRRSYFSSVDDTGEQYMNPRSYAAAGDTTFQVVVYDTNGNRTQLLRYITLTNSFISGSKLTAPELNVALSVTFGKQLDFFSVGPQAAPAGTNLFVRLVWQPKFNINPYPPDIFAGYRIYRSFDGENYAPIGVVSASENQFIDSSPDLAVGKTVYYKVSAILGNDESELSNALKTTPLDVFTVNLVSPADNATDVSVTPTFSWQTSDVGNYKYVGLALWDTLSGEMATLASQAQPFLVNRTSYTWNEDGTFDGTEMSTLQPGRSYEWEVFEAFAVDDATHPTAVSIAADRFGLWTPIGIPSGLSFTFTTAP